METATKTIEISIEKYEELLKSQEDLVELTSKFLSISTQLVELQRMVFGSKSERFVSNTKDSNQLNFFEEPQVEEKSALKETKVSYIRKTSKGKKPKRSSLPSHLERVIDIVEPESLAANAEKLGEEVSEKYEYKPGKLYVKQTVRPIYAQSKEKSENDSSKSREIIVAPIPAHPFPKSSLGISLATHILVSKFIDHLPIYRQRQIFTRENVSISASTIDGWLSLACKLLEPLFALLLKIVQASDYLQADESTIKVMIDKVEKKKRNKKKSQLTGYYWALHAVREKLVIFRYFNSRASDCATTLIGNFLGILQTDGYKAYDQIGQKEGMVHLACMAHVRRYFEKALDTDKQLAGHCMEVIQKLYTIEKELHQNPKPNDSIIQVNREQRSKPLLDEWKKWLTQTQIELASKVRKEDKLWVAINYTLSQWSKIVAYVNHGEVLIDNNAIENKIRPIALGRKNYLFAGSHKGAERGAMMYSFFACCKLNDINPSEWLSHVFEKIPTTHIDNEEELNKLLPHNFNPMQRG